MLLHEALSITPFSASSLACPLGGIPLWVLSGFLGPGTHSRLNMKHLANQFDSVLTVSREGSTTPKAISGSPEPSASTEIMGPELLFTDHGIRDSPFTEVTVDRGLFDKAACIKELERIAESYGFELVEFGFFTARCNLSQSCREFHRLHASTVPPGSPDVRCRILCRSHLF